MRADEVQGAVAAAIAVAASLGLAADEVVVLSDSNRLVVRLMPCDMVARVAPAAHFASAELEVELVARLARTNAPVAGLDGRVEQRVFERDGFQIALWTHFEPVPERTIRFADYGSALEQLHVGLRQIDVVAPHFLDRVSEIQHDVALRDVTPDLSYDDRALLADTLRDLRQLIVGRNAPEQLLHGEPHPWNLLDTTSGLRFIDFENAVRGPVEYDLAWVPDEVSTRYPGADQNLVDMCRGVILSIIAAHRWRHNDQHPSGRQSGVAFVNALRRGSPYPALDDIAW